MKQLTFMGGSRETYESPATRIIVINLSTRILDNSFTSSNIQSLTNGSVTATDEWSDE